MKARVVNPNERCKFFRGVYLGSCEAGIPFSQVEDKNRVDESPRHPCCPSEGSFTQCPKYERDVQWERFNRSVGTRIKIIKQGFASKSEPGILLGVTLDKREAFVTIIRNGNQTKPQRVKADRIRFLLKGKKETDIEQARVEICEKLNRRQQR